MNNQNLNLIVAVLLSIGIMFGWQHFVERPKLQNQVVEHQQYNKVISTVKNEQKDADVIITRAEALKKDKRVTFQNSYLKGSISLVGLRIDDLSFLKYKKQATPDSENVNLLVPNKTADAYFVEFGWHSNNQDILLPNQDTLWSANSNSFAPGEAVTFSWNSPQNILFKVVMSLDDQYMLNIRQEVVNNSLNTLSVQLYGLIYKTFNFEQNRMAVIHEGASGVFQNELKEFTYKDIKDKKKIENKLDNISWLGITDKYWMVMFVPDQSLNYTSNTSFTIRNSLDRYQVDFISPLQVVQAGDSISVAHRLFAGAKELPILDAYEEKLNIKLFDRTIDFGWFYIITKPLLYVLHFFYSIVENFGVSIMIVTVLVKLAMFSLANKSYKSMKIMKDLQPQIERIKANCGDDKMRLNQEVMALYKSHKVNPLSGCLPMFIQIPVFFSLYKVLNVSIEMRHAPFFGWITDLSVADPTNLFNLFGLLPFNPPAFLHIGVWPLLMGVTMYLQQKMSPPASDPVQAQMMKMMPLIFLFMFSSFPAGLLIYWTWNNILSIAQQAYINKSNA